MSDYITEQGVASLCNYLSTNAAAVTGCNMSRPPIELPSDGEFRRFAPGPEVTITITLRMPDCEPVRKANPNVPEST